MVSNLVISVAIGIKVKRAIDNFIYIKRVFLVKEFCSNHQKTFSEVCSENNS